MLKKLLELPFKLAGMIASALGTLVGFATSNFFVVFAVGVFVIYVAVFHFFGKH